MPVSKFWPSSSQKGFPQSCRTSKQRFTVSSRNEGSSTVAEQQTSVLRFLRGTKASNNVAEQQTNVLRFLRVTKASNNVAEQQTSVYAVFSMAEGFLERCRPQTSFLHFRRETKTSRTTNQRFLGSKSLQTGSASLQTSRSRRLQVPAAVAADGISALHQRRCLRKASPSALAGTGPCRVHYA